MSWRIHCGAVVALSCGTFFAHVALAECSNLLTSIKDNADILAEKRTELLEALDLIAAAESDEQRRQNLELAISLRATVVGLADKIKVHSAVVGVDCVPDVPNE